MSNADIAGRLLSLAQLLSARKENPFKVKAYRRAAGVIKDLGDSVEELVREGADLTALSGIGSGIASVVGEIVLSGSSRTLEALKAQVSPEVAAISEYPRLDAARVLRIYKKFKISSIDELRVTLESGEVAAAFGARMDQHMRQALSNSSELRLYDAARIVEAAEDFLLSKCKATQVAVAGDYRRKVEILSGITFLGCFTEFSASTRKLETFGGGTELVSADQSSAVFRSAAGIFLRIENTAQKNWGMSLLLATGSEAHLEKLNLSRCAKARTGFPDEHSVYRKLGLQFIEPELREGLDEVELAERGGLPVLIEAKDIRGELHAHTTSSDGAHSIQQMASAAAARGYEYTGITDHSKSLKIAGGVSEEDLWKQIRFIDKLNAAGSPIRILKSAEVDILADGSLDYSDELLSELDYTVCSIHSKFVFGKEVQTERIMRAMDNRNFNILGHATGRMLLKRPGYEIDVERVIERARQNGCFFEINSSPDRLDFSAENARLAKRAGVKIAINTDAHSMGEYGLAQCGIEQARRAGLDKEAVLNTRSWHELERLFKR